MLVPAVFGPNERVELLLIVYFMAMPNALLYIVAVPLAFHYELLTLALYSLLFQLYHVLLVLGVTSFFAHIISIGSFWWLAAFVFSLLLVGAGRGRSTAHVVRQITHPLFLVVFFFIHVHQLVEDLSASLQVLFFAIILMYCQ